MGRAGIWTDREVCGKQAQGFVERPRWLGGGGGGGEMGYTLGRREACSSDG